MYKSSDKEKEDEGEEAAPEDYTTEIIIRKQRNGPTGTVKLLFNPKCTRFEALSEDEEMAVAAPGREKAKDEQAPF